MSLSSVSCTITRSPTACALIGFSHLHSRCKPPHIGRDTKPTHLRPTPWENNRVFTTGLNVPPVESREEDAGHSRNSDLCLATVPSFDVLVYAERDGRGLSVPVFPLLSILIATAFPDVRSLSRHALCILPLLAVSVRFKSHTLHRYIFNFVRRAYPAYGFSDVPPLWLPLCTVSSASSDDYVALFYVLRPLC